LICPPDLHDAKTSTSAKPLTHLALYIDETNLFIAVARGGLQKGAEKPSGWKRTVKSEDPHPEAAPKEFFTLNMTDPMSMETISIGESTPYKHLLAPIGVTS
jgi:hypothetical protein